MKILIAGGSGFVGRGLSSYLSKSNELTLLTRSHKTPLDDYSSLITWDDLDKKEMSEYDIVINLCGFNIGERRWSSSVKNKIISSRVEPTKKLVELIGNDDIWLINASAIGFYSFSKVAQDEENHITKYDKLTFSQEVVDCWETAVVDSELKRYSLLRFGVVIGNGGVLEKMSMSAKFGFITMFGKGDQYLSWISLYDLCRAVNFIIQNRFDEREVFNLTAPNFSQHRMFVKLLRKYLAKKYILKMPEVVIRILFGQMGDELLLSDQNIKPKKLISKGFVFKDSKMQKALERYL